MIKAEAVLHKVCLVCASIARHSAVVCPVCVAYQWDETPAAVIAAVDLAALSVFSATLGYAPSDQRQPEWPPPLGWRQNY